ncbi:MAG: helix-turn-helix transcriptional regulator [Vulcanimicrobiota bacterium]
MSKPKVDPGAAEDFAARLRELRRRRNFTQAELARRAGVSHVHIGRLEKGVSQPTADFVKKLADALGVMPGYLIDGSQQEAVTANIEDLELAQQFQQLARLPREDKAIIKSVVDAFLFQRQVQSLSRGA